MSVRWRDSFSMRTIVALMVMPSLITHAQAAEVLDEALRPFAEETSTHAAGMLSRIDAEVRQFRDERADVLRRIELGDHSDALWRWEHEVRPGALAAAHSMRRFLVLFPRDRHAYALRWQLAQVWFQAGQYARAAEQAAELRDSPRNDTHRLDAARLALSARTYLVESPDRRGPEHRDHPPTPVGRAAPLPIPPVLLAQAGARDALVRVLGNDAESTELAAWNAHLYYQYGHWEQARSRLARVLRASCMRHELGREALRALVEISRGHRRKQIAGRGAFCTFGARHSHLNDASFARAVRLLESIQYTTTRIERREAYLSTGLAFLKAILETGRRPQLLGQVVYAFERAGPLVTPPMLTLLGQALRRHCPSWRPS